MCDTFIATKLGEDKVNRVDRLAKLERIVVYKRQGKSGEILSYMLQGSFPDGKGASRIVSASVALRKSEECGIPLSTGVPKAKAKKAKRVSSKSKKVAVVAKPRQPRVHRALTEEETFRRELAKMKKVDPVEYCYTYADIYGDRCVSKYGSRSKVRCENLRQKKLDACNSGKKVRLGALSKAAPKKKASAKPKKAAAPKAKKAPAKTKKAAAKPRVKKAQ